MMRKRHETRGNSGPLKHKFGTTILQVEREYKALNGSTSSPTFFNAGFTLKSQAEIYKLLRDGSAHYHAGKCLEGSAAASHDGRDLMRRGVEMQLEAVLAFCHFTMDYRFTHALGVLAEHARHLLDLRRGVQAPYLEKTARKGKPPDPMGTIQQRARCVVAFDWLRKGRLRTPAEAKRLIMSRTQDREEATLDTWGKPLGRARMQKEIDWAWMTLRFILEFRPSNDDIESLLDDFLGPRLPKRRTPRGRPQRELAAGSLPKRGLEHLESVAKR